MIVNHNLTSETKDTEETLNIIKQTTLYKNNIEN